jgi:hypothetical protein
MKFKQIQRIGCKGIMDHGFYTLAQATPEPVTIGSPTTSFSYFWNSQLELNIFLRNFVIVILQLTVRSFIPLGALLQPLEFEENRHYCFVITNRL